MPDEAQSAVARLHGHAATFEGRTRISSALTSQFIFLPLCSLGLLGSSALGGRWEKLGRSSLSGLSRKTWDPGFFDHAIPTSPCHRLDTLGPHVRTGELSPDPPPAPQTKYQNAIIHGVEAEQNQSIPGQLSICTLEASYRAG